MIDYFSIALTHGLILFACWRLLFRDDLDSESGLSGKESRPWLRQQDDSADA
ncbi:hypothetical protein [Aurantiacibacter odishensis]|uniref:hypothetical protein n=1 Tax=Aurantiacibacter odishensis TaxID=1155476 RepID=UPI0013C3FBF9|nr:hypothetical protein [Aurantiacibacter odishensis]